MSLGAKADNLELLSKNGYKVPQFYVISAKVLAGGDEQVVKQYQAWVAEHAVQSVAVRSSSNAEDLASKSFAGQFLTILDVKNEADFIAAVRKVLTHKPTKAYASDLQTQIHIIVQEFIEPDFAGVAFTVNPALGEAEIVINVAKGRGTQVVEGHAAEQYFVNRFLLTSSQDASNTILQAEQITQIAEQALQIETLFGDVQDIEWCMRAGELWILQARPITAVNHVRVWDSSNIAESFPGIVLPLTFSVARRGYCLVYKSQAYAAGLDWYQIESNHRIFDSMIATFNGRLYYNLMSWYKFIELFPGNKTNQKFLDQQLATMGTAVHRPASKLSLRFRIQFWLRAFVRTIFFKHELDVFYKRFELFEKHLESVPKSTDPHYLMQRFAVAEQQIIPHFGRTVDNDFLVMTYHGLLKKLIPKWLPDHPNVRFLGSMQDVISAQQATNLYKIAGLVKSDDRLVTLLDKKKYKEFSEQISGSEIEGLICNYQSTFGHRFANDQKVEAKNPLDDINNLYDLISTYTRLDLGSVTARQKTAYQRDKQNEAELANKLSVHRRLLFRFLLGRVKRHLRIREHNRLLRGKVYAYMRQLFPKLGQSFVEVGVLKQPEDVFYLEIDEIYQIMDGTLPADTLQETIRARKKSYELYKGIAMPERFMTTGIPTLEKVASPSKPKVSYQSKLEGTISSPGTIEGIVAVLDEPVVPKNSFDILVVRHTDPGWTPLLALAKGVIVEKGGMLSHAAIITRELGIPSIIGVDDVMNKLKSGQRVRINSEGSCIEIIQ